MGDSRLDETIMQLCTIMPLVEAVLFPSPPLSQRVEVPNATAPGL